MNFREIYVDIDQSFETFNSSRTAMFIRANVVLYNSRGNNKIDRIDIRRSSSGNVHLKIFLNLPVDFLGMMVLRSLMHDDVYRMAIDLRRSYFQGEQETNRIFSSKWKDGKEYRAGEWQRWDWEKESD